MKHLLLILLGFGLVGCAKEISYNCFDLETVTISKDRTHAKLLVGDLPYQVILQPSFVTKNKITYCGEGDCYSFNKKNIDELSTDGLTCKRI